MGNEQVSQPQLALQVLQQIDHLRLYRHIQRSHRLVQNQQPGLERQCPGNANALALTARELLGVALHHGGGESHHLKQLRDPFSATQ